MPEVALIDMGDFVGGMLKYLRRHPIPRVTLAGGFAKLAKLAGGHLDLHSSRSTVDLPGLAELLAGRGAASKVVAHARDASSAHRCWSWPARWGCRSPTTSRRAHARWRSGAWRLPARSRWRSSTGTAA